MEFVEPVSESTGKSVSATTNKKISADDRSKSSAISGAKDKVILKDKPMEPSDPGSDISLVGTSAVTGMKNVNENLSHESRRKKGSSEKHHHRDKPRSSGEAVESDKLGGVDSLQGDCSDLKVY